MATFVPDPSSVAALAWARVGPSREKVEEDMAWMRLAALTRIDAEIRAEVEHRWQLSVRRAQARPQRAATKAEAIAAVARDVMQGVL